MCKIGDIIVLDRYKGDDNKEVSHHSFVVLSVDKGTISGMDYDLVANAISSIKNIEHKNKISKRKGVLLFNMDNEDVESTNGKEGFIKADCMYYFKRKSINFFIIGSLSVETWEFLEELIQDLSINNRLKINLNNL